MLIRKQIRFSLFLKKCSMKFFIIFTYTLLLYKALCIKNTNLHFIMCFCVILTRGQINWLFVFGLYFNEQMSLSKIHFRLDFCCSRTSRLFSSTSVNECDRFLLAYTPMSHFKITAVLESKTTLMQNLPPLFLLSGIDTLLIFYP